MQIPQRADQWIVFALMAAVSVVRLSWPTGLDIGVMEWAGIPLMLGLLSMACYVVCAACRLMARVLRSGQGPGGIRSFANLSFGLLIGLSLVPFTSTTVTIDLPRKLPLHVPRPARSDPGAAPRLRLQR